MTMQVEVDIERLLAGLEADSQALAGNARPAAQAMAQVFYDQARANVLRLNRVTGNLLAAIYQVYDDESSVDERGIAVYAVSWRTRGGGLPTAPHGHLVEYGYVQRYARYLKDGVWYTNTHKPLPSPRQVPATPFMRPAIEAGRDTALAEGEAVLLKDLL